MAAKRAADDRARALIPTIRELMAAGFISQRGLTDELNRRGILGTGSGRWHRTSVMRMLRRLDRLTSGKANKELKSKPVADVPAEALAPTIRKLQKGGVVTVRAIAKELNERGIPTPRTGKWHHTTVVRLLTRLGLIELGTGRTNNRLALKRAADARAKAQASTIRKLQKAGFVSVRAIMRELNKREVSASRGGKWHSGTVTRLLRRLEGLGPQ
jgi:hypothetical protein